MRLAHCCRGWTPRAALAGTDTVVGLQLHGALADLIDVRTLSPGYGVLR